MRVLIATGTKRKMIDVSVWQVCRWFRRDLGVAYLAILVDLLGVFLVIEPFPPTLIATHTYDLVLRSQTPLVWISSIIERWD
jgi:hypothetical protein